MHDDIPLSDLPPYRDAIEILPAPMLKVVVQKSDGQTVVNHAINDVVVGGNVLDYYKFQLSSSQLNKKFHGT